MPSGISSGAWGYSPQMVSGMNNKLEHRGVPLTYQLGLTSTPVNWNQGGNPLLNANKNWYSRTPFGKSKDLTKEICESFLKSNKSINPVTGRPIKANGPTYNRLVEQCKNLQNGIVPKASGKNELFEKFSVVYDDCDGRDPSIKKMTLNGKVYKRGTPAFYTASREQGTIRAMGCKQINITDSNSRDHHVSLQKFFEYNFS